jgi:hypothetical protein
VTNTVNRQEERLFKLKPCRVAMQVMIESGFISKCPKERRIFTQAILIPIEYDEK